MTWLTFHIAQLAYERIERAGREPTFVALHAARNVPAPSARAPRLRAELTADRSIEGAIRDVVRDAVASELKTAFASGAPNRGGAESDDDGFISIERAAKIADSHPATIRSWIRAGRLQAGRAGRHYKVRKLDVINPMQSAQVADITCDNKSRIAEIMADDRRPQMV
jgi:excisionase family DNA binding protein